MPRPLSFAAVLIAMAFGGRSDAQLINEFAGNPPGVDPATTMIELRGDPGASFSGVLVAIESDTDSALGTINDIFDGLSGTFDSDGLLTFAVDDFENPAFTLVLAEAFAGDGASDLDADDNNEIDPAGLALFTNVFDAINVPNSAADAAVTFGSDFGGLDLPFIDEVLQLVFRDSETLEFLALDDDGPGTGMVVDASGNGTGLTLADGFNTFGAVNPTLNAPLGQPGDFDGDGDVDELDYLALRDAAVLPSAADFNAFVDNFGAGTGLIVGSPAIPEPGTGASLLIAVSVVGLRRRR